MGLKLVLVRTRHRAWMDREIGGAHMGKYWDRIWGNIPIAHKLFLEIALTAAALFASNLLIYAQINRMVVRMDSELHVQISGGQGFRFPDRLL